MGTSEIEIPGGLAGIRERMAQMGHSMNAPPPPDDFDTGKSHAMLMYAHVCSRMLTYAHVC